MSGEDATPSRELFDKGLQPERTALAWRRTALALAVGALVSVRVLPSVLGSWALIPAGAGVVAALVIAWAAHRRHVRTLDALSDHRDDGPPGPGALLLLTLVVVSVGGGAAAMAVVLTQGI
jgi:putative membrane protein